MRHLGRASFFIAVASWAILTLALVFGGLSPTASRTWLLQTLTGSAVIAAVVASGLAIVALVRGPQRILAGFGLALAVLFLLLFTGATSPLIR